MSTWAENIISRSDFEGDVLLPSNALDELQVYVNMVANEAMLRMLGIDVFEAFEASVASGSPDQKWTDLIEGKKYTSEGGNSVYFKGIKRMLLCFIYSDYLSKDFIQTFSGGKNRDIDNTSSTSLTVQNNYNFDIFNEGVVIYREALYFLKSDLNNYTGFKYKSIREKKQIQY